MRKPTVKSAKTRAWNAISAFIREKYPQCVTCIIRGKKTPTTQCGHYQHNSDKPNKQLGGNKLWYYEENFGGQCTFCNCYNSGQLADFAIFLEKKYGKGILQKLNRLYLTPKKWTIEELLEIERTYQQKLSAKTFRPKPMKKPMKMKWEKMPLGNSIMRKDGWKISFNPDTGLSARLSAVGFLNDLRVGKRITKIETALIIGDEYYILNSDWRSNYETLSTVEEAMSFYRSKEKDFGSDWSTQ